jgi:hypothetical protein
MTQARRFASLVLLPLMCGEVAAQTRTVPVPIPCTCRAAGQDVPVGTTVCLNTPTGGRLATCSLVQNNTSWDITADPCTTSRRDAPVSLASYGIGQTSSTDR